MLRDVVQLLLYALLAAFSPLALAATMTAIQAGRRQALGLGVGFVAGQLVTTALFVILTQAGDQLAADYQKAFANVSC